MLNDPIADMLTRIRNSNIRSKRKVLFPYSDLKFRICDKLKSSGFFTEVWIASKNKEDKESIQKKLLGVKIKYNNKNSLITHLKRISKGSKRVYMGSEEIRKSCLGRRTYIISTNKGLMTDQEAVNQKIGGEVLFFVGKKYVCPKI